MIKIACFGTRATASLILASMLNLTGWSQSSVNVGTVQVFSIGHTFGPASSLGGPAVTDFLIDQQQRFGGGGIVGSVSANFDLSNQFALTISAPPGEEFLIHVPAAGRVQFGGHLGWSNPDGYYGYYAGGVSASFGGLSGVAPSFSSSAFEIAQNHAAFEFEFGSSYLSGDIAFTSLTLTGTALAQNIGVGEVTYSPSAIIGDRFYAIYYPPSGQSSDPGSFVSIVAIPEPATTTFFIAGVLPLIIFAARRVSWTSAAVGRLS